MNKFADLVEKILHIFCLDTEIKEAYLQYINKNLNECITSNKLNLWLAYPLK